MMRFVFHWWGGSGKSILGRGRILSKRNVLSELGRAPSVKRRKCISPIAVEESIYIYAVKDDIWMQITGEENVDVEKVYRVMR